MRCYHLCNMYLEGLQAGLQSAHTQHELAMKYRNPSNACDAGTSQYVEWATHHKTLILLNGGHSENLRKWIDFLDNDENPYPWAFFHESEDALDGALTNVCVVLPERMYAHTGPLIDVIPTVLLTGPATFAHRGARYTVTPSCNDKYLISVEVEGMGEQLLYTEYEVELMRRLSEHRLM